MNIRERKRHGNILGRVALVSLISAVVGSCSSKPGADIPITKNQKSGNLVPRFAAKYIDDSPSIAKNGTKILFRSGRDNGVSRIYKTTWSSGAWSAPEKLAATSGMTSETIAKISPDGTKALVQGLTGSGKVLSICDVAAGSCSVIASHPWKYGEFAFSPDSTMFFYMKGSESTGASIYVAATTAGANAYMVGTENAWTKAVWSADGSSTYALLTAATNESSGRLTLSKWAFNTPVSNIASAQESNLGADISGSSILDPYSASTARFTVTTPPQSSNKKVFSELGSYSGADKKSISMTNEIHTWLINGSDEGAITAATGSQTLFAWVTNDDATIFTLNSVSIRCTGDSLSTTGQAIALINRADNAVTWRHLKKPIELSKGPSTTEDPCDRTISGSATTMDMSVSEIAINRDATAATHTVVWTSTMTGDSEVFASVTSGGTTSVYNASGNRKP